MEPISAAFVVGMLATWARHLGDSALEIVDDASKSGLEALWKRVANRFRRDDGATAALERLQADPDNPRRAAAVEDYLADELAADPSFADELARVTRTISSGSIVVKGSGATAIGGDVTISGGRIAGGRDVVIGAPAADLLADGGRHQAPAVEE